jgi:hypothetical protein
MLLFGHESATVKSALACRTQSATRFANGAVLDKFLSPVTAARRRRVLLSKLAQESDWVG